MPSINEKTFVVEFKKTLDNKAEVQANSVDVRGDFIIFLDQHGKGMTAFASSTVLKVTVKAAA